MDVRIDKTRENCCLHQLYEPSVGGNRYLVTRAYIYDAIATNHECGVWQRVGTGTIN